MRIKDLIGEITKPTYVVQLRKLTEDEEGITNEIQEITKYVITSEIRDNIERSFTTITKTLGKNIEQDTTCFLIRGDFGTGKSHFLSFLALLFGKYDISYRVQCWEKLSQFDIKVDQFQELKSNNFLVVPIALQHYLREDLNKIIFQRIEEEFEKKYDKKILMSDEAQLMDWWQKKPENIREYYLNMLDENDLELFNKQVPLNTEDQKQKAKLVLKAAKLAQDKPDIKVNNEVVCQHLSEAIDEINKTSSNPCLGTILLIDEFSEYLLGQKGSLSDPDSNKHRALVELQSLAELANNHKIIMFVSEQQAFKQLTELVQKTRSRFTQLNLSMKFFGSIIEARIFNEEIKRDNRSSLIQIYHSLKHFIPREFPNKVPKHFRTIENYFITCYPFHPLTIEISEKYLHDLTTSERAAMSYAYQTVLKKMNDDIHSLITPDTLWDYFFEDISDIREKYKPHVEFYNQVENSVLIDEKVGKDLELFEKIIKTLLLISPNAYTIAELEKCVCEENIEGRLKNFYTLCQKNLPRSKLVEQNGQWSINLESQTVGLDQEYINRLIKLIDDNLIKEIVRKEALITSQVSKSSPTTGVRMIKSEWGAIERSGFMEFINASKYNSKIEHYFRLLAEKPNIKKTKLEYNDFAFCILFPLKKETEEFTTFLSSIKVSDDPRIILWVPSNFNENELSSLKDYISLNILYDEIRNETTDLRKKAKESSQIGNILQKFREEISQDKKIQQEIKASLSSKIDLSKSEIKELINTKYFSDSSIYFQKERIPIEFYVIDVEKNIREILQQPLQKAYPNYPQFGYKKFKGRTQTRYVISSLNSSEKGIIKVAKGKKEDVALKGIGIPLNIIKKVDQGNYQFEIKENNPYYKVIADLIKREGKVSFSTVFKKLRVTPYGLTPEVVELVIASLLFADYIEILPERGETWTSANVEKFLDSKIKFNLDSLKIREGKVISPDTWAYLIKIAGVLFQDDKFFQDYIKNSPLTKKAQVNLWDLFKKYNSIEIMDVRKEILEFVNFLFDKENETKINDMMVILIDNIFNALILLNEFEVEDSESGLKRCKELFKEYYPSFEEFQSDFSNLTRVKMFIKNDKSTLMKNVTFLNNIIQVKKGIFVDRFKQIKDSLDNKITEFILEPTVRREWLTEFFLTFNEYIKEFTKRHENFHKNKTEFWNNYEESPEFKLIKDLSSIEMVKEQISLPENEVVKKIKEIRGKICTSKEKQFQRSVIEDLKCKKCNFQMNDTFNGEESKTAVQKEMRTSIYMGFQIILKNIRSEIAEKEKENALLGITKGEKEDLTELAQLMKNFSAEKLGRTAELFHQYLPLFLKLFTTKVHLIQFGKILEEIRGQNKIFTLDDLQSAIVQAFNKQKNKVDTDKEKIIFKISID